MPRPTYAYLNPTAPRPGDRPGAEKFFNLGAQAHRDGKLTSAITEYLVAVKTDPAYFEAHYNLGLAAFEAGNLPRSLSAYEQALSIKPTDSNTRYNFALALQQAGHVRDAANELEILLTASPRETRAHLTLAQLYAQSLNQKSRAREHYQRVIDLDPKHPQATPIRVWLGANP
jgi:tetratricopeptide (TPR) repeat protein